jgi:protein-disulfide isomerase
MMQAIETMALKFSDKVSIEIRNPRAGSRAARASLAAAQQGAYWQMVECLAQYGTSSVGIDACAGDAKLDRVALEQSMSSPTITAAIDDDRERARVAGVDGPAIVIGDRVFRGPQAHLDARAFVNAALARRTL